MSGKSEKPVLDIQYVAGTDTFISVKGPPLSSQQFQDSAQGVYQRILRNEFNDYILYHFPCIDLYTHSSGLNLMHLPIEPGISCVIFAFYTTVVGISHLSFTFCTNLIHNSHVIVTFSVTAIVQNVKMGWEIPAFTSEGTYCCSLILTLVKALPKKYAPRSKLISLSMKVSYCNDYGRDYIQ